MPELRARLIEARGLDDAHTGPAAAGVDAICDAVRAWLESLGTDARVRDAEVTNR